VWLTGRSGAGRTTVGRGIVDELCRRGRAAVLLDEPEVRAHLGDGTASLVWLCRLLVGNGVTTVVAVDAPGRDERERIRAEIPGFVEVFIDRGRTDDPFEEPVAPELRVPTHDRDARASVAQVLSWLEHAGLVPHDPPHPAGRARR
jgi:adenylylsulfate kinase